MSRLRVTPDEISGLTIFAPNFKPYRGGVAEYTYQLAWVLNNLGFLDRVITTVPQERPSNYGFDVTSVRDEESLQSERSFTRKIKDRLRSYWAFYTTFARRSETHVLATWIQGIEPKRFLMGCIKYDISFSVVLHGYDIVFLLKRDTSYLKEVCRQAEVLIFNSEATRELFSNRVFSPEQSHVLYPGINTTQLDAASKTSTTVLEKCYDIELRGKTVILSVARLVERKGIDIALNALAPILDASDDYRYVIAGTGPEFDSLKSEVDRLGLADKVKLTGEVSDTEKYGLLESSSLFLMPNHTCRGDDFEGFGISFIEASYFENVVIGGRSGGAVEAISEDVSGFLIDFEEGNREERLRELLRSLISQPERIDELSSQGRKYVIDNFRVSELIEDFWGDIKQ